MARNWRVRKKETLFISALCRQIAPHGFIRKDFTDFVSVLGVFQGCASEKHNCFSTSGRVKHVKLQLLAPLTA